MIESLENWMHSGRDDYGEEDLEDSRDTICQDPISREIHIKAQRQVAVLIAVPKQLEDLPDIADAMKSFMTVVLNVQTVDPSLERRILDILAGVAYAIDTGVARIAKNTYIFFPSNVEFEDKQIDTLLNSSFMSD